MSVTNASTVAETTPTYGKTEVGEIEYINRNAERLNKEAEDVLLYQSLDALDENLARLTPQELADMRDTIVPFGAMLWSVSPNPC